MEESPSGHGTRLESVRAQALAGSSPASSANVIVGFVTPIQSCRLSSPASSATETQLVRLVFIKNLALLSWFLLSKFALQIL